MDARKFCFTQIEKKLLIEIVKKHQTVVENKNTDGATVRAKNAAWDQIAVEYNASPLAHAQATHKQLRRLWTNLKQRQRDALTRERQHRLATGGGPPAAAADVDPDLTEFNSTLLVEVPGAIDSDASYTPRSPERPIDVEEYQLSSPAIVTPDMGGTHERATTAPVLSSAENNAGGAGGLVRLKRQVLLDDCANRQRRLEELHQLEMQLLQKKIEEATANAELAKFRFALAKRGVDQE